MSVWKILTSVGLETVLIMLMEHFMNVIVKLEQQPQEQVLMVLSHALVGVFLPLVSVCTTYLFWLQLHVYSCWPFVYIILSHVRMHAHRNYSQLIT